MGLKLGPAKNNASPHIPLDCSYRRRCFGDPISTNVVVPVIWVLLIVWQNTQKIDNDCVVKYLNTVHLLTAVQYF